MNSELSFTEENYLKAIYHLSGEGSIVTTNSLAEEMQTSPASVNDMMKKLASKKLIDYRKYKGATLLSSGEKLALQVIRKHRLWEVFLVEKLQFKWDEVHEVAEQLEHIKSKILVERLDDFLGRPTVDPHGDPIPDREGNMKEVLKASLDDLPVGTLGILVNISMDDSSLLQHLDRLGIGLGNKIELLERTSFDDSITIEIEGGSKQFLSKEVAKNLMMTVINKP